jgi:hypothetical protein
MVDEKVNIKEELRKVFVCIALTFLPAALFSEAFQVLSDYFGWIPRGHPDIVIVIFSSVLFMALFVISLWVMWSTIVDSWKAIATKKEVQKQ